MSDREREGEGQVVIGSADELLSVSTRRKFIRLLGVGGSIVMLPGVFAACGDDDDDDITGVQSPPPPPMSPPPPPGVVTALAFDLRNDVGILRMVHTLEIVEAAFYSAVVAKTDFEALFSGPEQEVLRDIRNVEVLHAAVVRAGLGAQAVPDFTAQLNQATLTPLLASRASILRTARMLEHTGVATLNGAGKYLRDARNLLFAGKAVSVEARHAAALRDIEAPAGIDQNTAFAGDDIITANGLDLKLEAPVTLSRVKSLNVVSEPLNAALTISFAPTADQGAATPDHFPASAAT